MERGEEMNVIEIAATMRKSVSTSQYKDRIETHTDGMAELLSYLMARPYKEVRAKIVRECDEDQRTALEASKSLHGLWH
jgi:hypothetical protein